MTEDVKKELEGIAKDAEAKLTSLEKQITEATKDKASAEQFDALKKNYEETVETTKKLALEVDKLKNFAPQPKTLSIGDEIGKALKENEKAITELGTKTSGRVRFKAATTISTGNFGSGVIQGLREPGVSGLSTSPRFIFNLISSMNGGPGSNPISWVNRVPKEGGAEFVSESGTKPKYDFTYTKEEATAQFIAATIPVTMQALLNMPILEQEIRDELITEVGSKLDYAILRAGTGTPPSINSIWGYAKTFTAGTFAGAIVNATEADVLRIAIGQVEKGESGIKSAGYVPDYAFVSKDIYTKLDVLKTATFSYDRAPFLSADNTIIKGVKILPTNYLSDDEFIVGDMKKYLWNTVSGLTIDVGWVNAQFIENQVTVRAELYGMGRVKAHETYAFVKGNFSTAVSAILKP